VIPSKISVISVSSVDALPKVDKIKKQSRDQISNLKISGDSNRTKANYFNLEEQSFQPKWQTVSN